MVDIFSILHLSLNGNQRGEDENVAGMKCSFLEVPKVMHASLITSIFKEHVV